MQVILVDKKDNPIGEMEKIRAHELGRLHRAFSIFIFNSKNELLLQRRALHKYHSGGLWTNTCCSHPSPGENTLESAKKRLYQEMGFSTDLEEKFSFIYRAELDSNLREHEYDHVFFGRYDKDPMPNKDEVMEYKWISLSSLKEDVVSNPDKYTYWLKTMIDRVIRSF